MLINGTSKHFGLNPDSLCDVREVRAAETIYARELERTGMHSCAVAAVWRMARNAAAAWYEQKFDLTAAERNKTPKIDGVQSEKQN